MLKAAWAFESKCVRGMSSNTSHYVRVRKSVTSQDAMQCMITILLLQNVGHPLFALLLCRQLEYGIIVLVTAVLLQFKTVFAGHRNEYAIAIIICNVLFDRVQTNYSEV